MFGNFFSIFLFMRKIFFWIIRKKTPLKLYLEEFFVIGCLEYNVIYRSSGIRTFPSRL